MSENMKQHLNIDEAVLKEIIRIKEEYFNGKLNLEDARSQVKAHVSKLKPWEFAYAEQALKDHVDDEEIQDHIDQVLELFDGILETPDQLKQEIPPSAQAYLDEADEVEKVIARIRSELEKPYIHNVWEEFSELLEQWKTHNSRKQNQLYPALETKGFDRPSVIMWAFDDEIRDAISRLTKAVASDDEMEVHKHAQDACDQIESMLTKERNILIPTSLELLDQDMWDAMKASDWEIGFAFIKPAWGEKPQKRSVAKAGATQSSAYASNVSSAQINKTLTATPSAGSGFADELQELLHKHGMITDEFDPTSTILDVANGKLTLEQINLMYRHLPVDFSYVDENDKVCFYSDTNHRIFPRSAGVIGRDVHNCHPRSSVYVVKELISKFRSGEEDTAEFWIDTGDAFIYISYYAIRDDEGNYRGVLEMMQDATRIRSLEGSRTLLTFENEEQLEKQKEADAPLNDADQITSVHGYGITGDTKMADLIKKYPYLQSEMKEINPKYAMLENLIAAKTALKVATITMVASVGGYEVNELITLIDQKIAKHEGEEAEEKGSEQ